MRIAMISDTHTMHERIAVPAADALIHAGDMTLDGRADDIFRMFAWLSKQPHKRVIVIPGNHDFGFEKLPTLVDVLKAKFPRIEVLIDQETMLGDFRVWGSPWQPWFHDWAYNFAPGEKGRYEAQNKWDEIPDDTAILITHGPPYGILDKVLRGERVGCPALKARIGHLPQMRLHIFGHIHEGYGTQKIGDVLYANACSCDAQYQPSQLPIVVDLDDKGITVIQGQS